ncbi:MAG TPA: NAD-dependent epimerase/dehydratase family protein [Symbiobacteriaceae bacterium]|nr:NAD-dependent epimerase/dehydratase family protein [Symbiobacteriaceae bacterium]
MKILLIGGTEFLGRHIVDAALALGHEVTLFNRGQTNPDLFPAVQKLRGDRDGGLDVLKGRRWDAVIDTCGYVPRVVAASAQLLAGAVEHYTFVSTCSVYPLDKLEPDEAAPVVTLADETIEQVTGQTYGGLKALCEKAAEAAMPGRVLVVRPGLIVGPHDPTDRFTYWPVRVARGGEVLAPGRPEVRVQVIDGRDLASFIVRMVEARATGIYNTTGPERRLTLGELLVTAKEVSGSDATFTWVPDEFLVEQKAGPWREIPLWVPDGGADGIFSVNSAKAFAAGLVCRPLAETCRDTIAWDGARPQDREWQAGLKPGREAEILAAWHGC